jgi:uncharacterized membrane protein
MKPERLSFFSDGVFAVLITVLVLELHPPEYPTFAALLDHWPSWLSYAVSYLFIAIVWANHHYLLHHATEATLLPLSTAWMAVSKLSPEPVAFYAAVFFFVNATYILLIGELIKAPAKSMRIRSYATLVLFGIATVVALKYPYLGLGICCCCLIGYLRPAAPGSPG